MIQLRAVTIYRYVSIRTWPIPYRYAWVPYHDTFRYLLVKNLVISNLKIYIQAGLQIFFQEWWADVTHGAKNGGSFSEMIGPSISN